MNLLYGHDKELSAIASKYFGINLEPCTAIGIRNNNLLTGIVVFNNQHKNNVDIPLSIEASVILLDKHGLTKYVISELLRYTFIDLKVKTLFVRVARKNKRHRNLTERLGFRFVGILRDAYPSGGDAALYDMQARECIWT